MTSSPNPAPIAAAQPASTPRPATPEAAPRPAKAPARFVIKLRGIIPT